MKLVNLSQESFLALARAEHSAVHADLDRQAMAELVTGYLSRFSVEVQIDDKPVGAFGILPGNIGCASTWAFITPELRTRAIGLMRLSEKLIAYAFDHFSLHRLEATVDKDFEAGCRYVEHLGFDLEGTRRNFGGPGKDFQMYARIKE